MLRRVFTICLLGSAVAACNGEIYLRDGVTDGDRFYVSPQAAADPDPVVQSWIRYSLARSICQLEIGGDNPARASSFDCEASSRRHLADAWHEHTRSDPSLENAYLDDLLAVREAGFLDEYVVHRFGRRGWRMPEDLAMRAYHRWRRSGLGGHRPETRIIGSWVYRRPHPAD